MLIFRGVFANESDPVVQGEGAEGLDEREKRQRCFRGSSTSKLSAVNQRCVRPLGPHFPPSPGGEGGGPTAGKKRTQPNRCRELQVNVCVCM